MLVQLVLYSIPLILFATLIQSYLRLRNIPGPFLAAWTDLWRLLSVYNRKPHDEQVQLHRKYGDLVRLGPNCVSVCGPEYTSAIYGIGKGLVKSNFYSTFQNIVNGQRAASLVAMTDESQHAKSKRQIAHAYSLSTLVEFEPLVDSTTEVFLSVLEERFATAGQSCDLGRWLQFYAFDVIGELTFSKRLGFIETGTDVDSIINAIGGNFDYFSVLGQMPWLDSCLGKNPVYVKYFKPAVSSPILRFAQKLLNERLTELDNNEKPDSVLGKPDFLSRFLQARKESEEEPMSDRQILSNLFMNINAGSDTIASTLRGIFYFLLKNPSSLNTLVSELSTAHSSNKLTLPCPTWSETQALPYLCAVIHEGLRLNPALSLPLERIVPPAGLSLPTSPSSPTFLPGGTIVGINPYVLHRDSRLFGDDPDQWNPSRWLTQHQTTTKSMERNLLVFGAGKRSCLGKNIALLELHKLVPALLGRFEISLKNPEKEWEVSNAWVLNQTGLDVRVSLER